MGRRLDIGVYGARGLPSTYSGYETFLDVLLPELMKRGHLLTMYCRRGEVPDVGYYRGVRCVQLPAIRSQQFSTLSHGFVAAARSRMAGHDVVLVVNVANAASALLLRAAGVRIVLNTDGQEWLRGKWSALGRKVFYWSARLARWSSGALVSDCVAMREVYTSMFGSDSTVIPYCWTELQPNTDAAIFDTLGIRRRAYFLIAGRLVPENNIASIAEVYLRSELAHPLVVLGAGVGRSPVADRLQYLAAHDERLVLVGHVDDRSVFAALLAEATAYVHGHSVGGLNPSLLEAMGCGARIVSLDTPFNRAALGPTGDYFTAVGNLVPLLRSILFNDRKSDERREEGMRRAREEFALGDVADAYEELLLEVASRPRWASTTIRTRWGGQALGEFNATGAGSAATNSGHTDSSGVPRLRRRAQAGT